MFQIRKTQKCVSIWQQYSRHWLQCCRQTFVLPAQQEMVQKEQQLQTKKIPFLKFT